MPPSSLLERFTGAQHRGKGFLSVLGVVTCGACAAPTDHAGTPRAVATPVATPAAKPSLAPTSPAETRPVPTAAVPKYAPRVYAKSRVVWVRERPSWASSWLGYLSQGTSVELADPRPVYARGCDAWYAVRPQGYVCVDRLRATLDGADPAFLAVARHAPHLDAASPYSYAASLGAEHYETLPDLREQHAREPDLRTHLSFVASARQGASRDVSLAGVDLTPAPEDAIEFANLPIEVQIQRRTVRRDSTLASLGDYEHDGRAFLLTSDFAWVPKDRVRPYPISTFRGVVLGRGTTLPLAFFRAHDRPVYRRTDSGGVEATGATFARLSWVALTGRRETIDGSTYLETTTHGSWVNRADAVVPEPSERTPWGARVGAKDDLATRPKGRATWIEASVYGGFLIAYEDTTPVFTTMISPGKGGAAPASAPNLTTTSSTPIGRFPISGKFITATMDAPEDVTHADVPWVQNFRGPHSIHAAYWHDAWGERVSGGCLNVSPEDGRWLFDFTEPKVPASWHAVRWIPELGPATWVIVHP
jgi:hypothetical protein